MKSCPFCSNHQDDNAVQCTICGYVFQQQSNQPYYQPYVQAQQKGSRRGYASQQYAQPQPMQQEYAQQQYAQYYSYPPQSSQENRQQYQQYHAYYLQNDASIINEVSMDAPQNSSAKISWIKILLVIVFIGIGYAVLNSFGVCNGLSSLITGISTNSQSSISDDFYIDCAKTAIAAKLRSPSTAIWYNEKVVEQDDYGRVLVTMTVEAQNGFGAYTKAYYAVVVYNCDPINQTFSYHRLNGVQYCESIDFFDITIEAAKNFSDWGLPFENDGENTSD